VSSFFNVYSPLTVSHLQKENFLKPTKLRSSSREDFTSWLKEPILIDLTKMDYTISFLEDTIAEEQATPLKKPRKTEVQIKHEESSDDGSQAEEADPEEDEDEAQKTREFFEGHGHRYEAFASAVSTPYSQDEALQASVGRTPFVVTGKKRKGKGRA
jgi:hypothetical protein